MAVAERNENAQASLDQGSEYCGLCGVAFSCGPHGGMLCLHSDVTRGATLQFRQAG
jgi:hypothetical protein